MKIPAVWREQFTDYIAAGLRQEAARLFRIHQLPEQLDHWKAAREKLRARIWQSLGVRVEPGLDLDCHETGVIKMDGYTIKKLYYQSRKGVYVTGNLYIPQGNGPFPAVLNVHGHHVQGRLAGNVQARGHSLAKNGYVCLAVDAFGAGERSATHGTYEPHGLMLGASLMNLGETLMGAQVVDNMRGIDLLCSLSYVDAANIGVTGASGGGNQTMWVAAMDERIKAAVPVVSVGTFQSYITNNNCICEVLPDGLTYTEESGVLALVAPRALKMCNCLNDGTPTFVPAEMLRSYEEARKVFRLYGRDDLLSYQIFNRVHGYWPEIREAMLGWFNLHLKGVGHGQPVAETPFECLPEDQVMVFKKGKRDGRVMSIAGHCRKQGAALRKTYLGRKQIDADTARNELARLLKVAAPLKLKAVHDYPAAQGWDRLALETECGRMVPLRIRRPAAGTAEYLLLAAPEEKDELIHAKILQDALGSGQGVAVPDLWGAGETARERIQIYHDLSRAILWLGRTMMGEWVRDYGLILSFLKEARGAAHVTVGGIQEAGLAALFASALSPQACSVILENVPVSYAFNKVEPPTVLIEKRPPVCFTMALFLPGFLAWGDVSLAASLVHGPVRFIHPVTNDGIALNKNEQRQYRLEFENTRRKTGVPGSTTWG